jgi:hypothetical protein
MASETDIYNLALAHVGTRSTIALPTEDSNEARACRRFYAQARDETLTAAWWTFARRTAVLTLLKSAPGTPEFQGVVSNVLERLVSAAALALLLCLSFGLCTRPLYHPCQYRCLSFDSDLLGSARSRKPRQRRAGSVQHWSRP